MNSQDVKFMKLAIREAIKGEGFVEPNPMVGCVVVDESGTIESTGYHQQFGGPHAEIDALSKLGAEDLSGKTVYVTLEPCAHFGKTPPCAASLASRNPARVVIATKDPFPQVDGAGIQILKDANITVDVGICEEESKRVLAPFLKLLRHNHPWIIAKWAMTLDGKIATHTGDSKWITSTTSRRIVHEIRSRVDAVLVGINTIIADDAMLNARLPDDNQPRRLATRVILDRQLRIPLNSAVVQTADKIPTLVFTCEQAQSINEATAKTEQLTQHGVEVVPVKSTTDSENFLNSVLDNLGQRRFTNVLVEGGGSVLGSFFDAGFVDEIYAFVAPKLAGGSNALPAIGGLGVDFIAQCHEFNDMEVRQIDVDTLFTGYLKKKNSGNISHLN